ncbi:cytochrome P450 [Asanoa ishikariensis]|uniref:Cytochrome P450 n=1 Tax=Asanoa ishikariensis TaxID=137265 RepID=A0A1H3MXM4_9ACTN|nr:cytochrome P450 [Asanoa ishikariensis]GIF66387.1 cytochrome P450 [Asanoa ishikariensis]SDY80995.1 Cytochrome P450 [Asanoa ishikariensis]
MTALDDATAVELPLPPAPSIYHPTPRLAELRANRPVAEVTFHNGSKGFLVTRYADVRQVLIDPRFSRAAAAGSAASDSGLAMVATDSILGMDPPEHTRLRRLVAGAFTARRVEELRPKVTALIDGLLGDIVAGPRPVDLVEHFSLPLPVRVICELLGVPPEDQHIFHAWSDTILSDAGADPAEIRAAMGNLGVYFGKLIADKRAAPADDLMTALIGARDDQDRLSEKELVNLCFGLLIAGHETTANQINMFLLTLLHFPEEYQRLAGSPELVPQAVEELMRFVQLGEGSGLPRVTTEAVELSGVTIPAGSIVMTSMVAANRDESVFTDADRLDLSREITQHLGFGAGAHHCLGAQLARMELQEALRGLLRHLPGLRIAVPDSELRFKTGMIVRSLQTLPVTW